MITVDNYADLQVLSPTSDPVYVKGRFSTQDGFEGVFLYDAGSTEPGNGGTIIDRNPLTTSGRWKRVIEEKVNVTWFGAVPDCYKGSADYTINPFETGIFGSPVIDSTKAIQAAIDFCIGYDYDLYFPAGKKNESGVYGEYLVTDTLKVYAPLNIYAELNATITGYILDEISPFRYVFSKTKPIFLYENCYQGKMENLTIQGCAYLPLAGIQYIASSNYDPMNPTEIIGYKDSQGMELYNVKIYNCRHGVYSCSPETINRLLFNRCVFASNLIAGFYLDSTLVRDPNDTNSWGSGPITFTHTIMNSNGILDWMKGNANYYGGGNHIAPSIQIIGDEDIYGYQMYAKGFANLSYIGGQLSAHGDTKLLSLVTLENGFGVNFSGVDIEDITNPVTETGAKIENYDSDYGSIAGAAILVRNVSGFNFTQTHFWNICTQAVFRFVDRCGDVCIQGADLHNDIDGVGNFKYSVDVQHTDWQTDEPITRLVYNGTKDKMSTSALNALDKSGMKVLSSVRGPFLPTPELDNIFTNYHKNGAGTKYVMKFKGAGTFINDANACYIEKDISGCTIIHVIIECSQNLYSPDGEFFIQQLQNGVSILEDSWSLQGGDHIGNSYYTYITYKIGSNINGLRYGFINKMNYDAEIPDHTTVKGFTVYADFKNPILHTRPLDLNF